jgi:hypothetical protein
MNPTYSVCLGNIERLAGLIDDGRHDHPDPYRPPPWCQDPALPRAREPRAAAPTGRLHGYIGYYHTARPHQSLDHNSPQPREVHPPELGRVVSIPQVGGLHHLYQRAA